MKQFLFILSLLLTLLSYGQSGISSRRIALDEMVRNINEKRNAEIGKPYPNFSVTTNDTEFSNQKLKGKVIFINFWFSSCEPCIEEMEDLNKLFDKFKSNENFEFLSFTFESPAQIEILKKKYNIHYKVFSVTNQECHRLNLYGGFPTNIVVDKNGITKYITQIGKADDFNETICTLISKNL